MPNSLPMLIAGDCLLYRPSGFFGWLISVKTWTKISHVEVSAGDGTSVASRDGLGVNRYAFRRDGLAYVLRPNQPYDHALAMAWFQTVRGQKYDWLGLFCFTLAVHQGSHDKMFCSEYATRHYRKGLFDVLSRETDADHVAPAQFLQTPALTPIWTDGLKDH